MSDSRDTLFSNIRSDNDDNLPHLLEHYRIYVENTDKLIDRRDKANTFFLSTNSFLLSALGIMTQINFSSLGISWIYVASAGGAVFAITWMLIVRSFRQLSSAKFKVINEMEKKLLAAPFTKEWELLGHGKNPKKYIKLTKIETIVPIIFCALYVCLSMLIAYPSIIIMLKQFPIT